jgi:hypothetical protein
MRDETIELREFVDRRSEINKSSMTAGSMASEPVQYCLNRIAAFGATSFPTITRG